jgi:transcriptional regulator with XRE-family HTH domain
MTQEPRRTLKAWREERKLTHDGVMRAGSGVSAQELARWEQTGTSPTRGRAMQLADALQTRISTIDFGPDLRGLEIAGCAFLLRTRERHDGSWRAEIDEWRGPQQGRELTPRAIAERARAGWHSAGPTSQASLDALEAAIRTAMPASTGAV